MGSSTPEILTESLDSVNMLSIQEGLQPGLKCVAVDIVGIRPFENKNSSNIFSSEPRLRTKEVNVIVSRYVYILRW